MKLTYNMRRILLNDYKYPISFRPMNKLYKSLLIIVLVVGASAFNQPDAKMYYESGMANLNKKDYIQAIGDFTNAISLNPNYADAYYHRAYAKDLLGKKMGFASTEL